MKTLYVTGGRQRARFLKTEEEWNLYERALILRIDVESNRSKICVDYQSPADACTSDGTPSFLFKTGTLQANILYVCTSTEVLIYEVPAFERIGYISLPCFNDLHHVCPTDDGNLLAANTGLDMVVEFTREGRVLREWNVLGGDPWERFSREIDYRRVATTKPHRSHPNHVFSIGGDIWVTRGFQGDAVCLTQPNRRIAVTSDVDVGADRAGERGREPLATHEVKPRCGSVGIHDGHLFNGRLYFTSVDGTIVIVDAETLQKVEVIDLKTIDNEAKALLGWCRGLLIEDENKMWVGFTRTRKTKFKENINWIKHVFHETEKPTHIALYDISARKLLHQIDLEKCGVNVIFGILPACES